MMRRSLAIPGPGNYEDHEKLKMDPRGSYQFSKWRSSGAPVFSRSIRNTNLETSVTRKSKNLFDLTSILVTPGPGTYRTMSEFGHLEAPSAPLSPAATRYSNA